MGKLSSILLGTVSGVAAALFLTLSVFIRQYRILFLLFFPPQ